MFGHMDVLKQMLNSEKETIKNNVGKIVNRLLSFALIKESLEECEYLYYFGSLFEPVCVEGYHIPLTKAPGITGFISVKSYL